MIQRFRFGLPLPTDSVVQEIPVSAGPVPFLTAEKGGWEYRMAPDAIVYGLGEMPRGINKRGWHYVTNNTDESRHSEDKLSYYGAHNFLLIDGGAGRECFGVFIDFPGKVRYDIGYTEYDALRFAPKSRIMSFTSLPATTRTISAASSGSSSGAAISRPSGPLVWHRAALATRPLRTCGRWPASTKRTICRWI